MPRWPPGRRFGLRIQRLEIRTRNDLRRAFEAAAKAGADAVVPLADPLTTVLTRDILAAPPRDIGSRR